MSGYEESWKKLSRWVRRGNSTQHDRGYTYGRELVKAGRVDYLREMIQSERDFGVYGDFERGIEQAIKEGVE